MKESSENKSEKIKKTRRSIKASGPSRVIKNNSAFKRAMVQMGIKSGEKIAVTFGDGAMYTVEKS